MYLRMAAKSKPCLLCGILFTGIVLALVVFYSGSMSSNPESVRSTFERVNTRSGESGSNPQKRFGQTDHESEISLQNPDMQRQAGIHAMSQDSSEGFQQTCRIPDQTDRGAELARVMDGYTGSGVAPDNPELIKKIRKHFIDLPRPYVTKFSMPLVETPQAKEVDKILKQKRGGFFVECGALDGERSSNTIWLEQKKGWNGLLVEMDPSYYLQVRGKNRKSYSINACLSPEAYPTKMQFKEHKMGEGRLVTDQKVAQKSPDLIIDTYCFPLYSLMLALNRTRIDYFSLDVEGMELPILKSIPFDKLDIAVLTVEYIHGQSSQEYLDFMASKGYKMVKNLKFTIIELYLGGNDFVFVREDLL